MSVHPDPAIVNGKPYRIILFGCWCDTCQVVTRGGKACFECENPGKPLYRLAAMSGRRA